MPRSMKQKPVRQDELHSSLRYDLNINIFKEIYSPNAFVQPPRHGQTNRYDLYNFGVAFSSFNLTTPYHVVSNGSSIKE